MNTPAINLDNLQQVIAEAVAISDLQAGDFLDEFTTTERLIWIDILLAMYRKGRADEKAGKP